ncbi:MAG TPA: T9SS type A sorting domain-containing protein, partial [Bacteroidia bacterium]|nr:T9SS type A sorting domain-containing protein [Bacteroidia bacterium]
GGTNTYALSDSVDTFYPGYDTAMAVQIFGCAFHLDVDNDGKRDLLFSPNALNTAENFKSVWYYHNTGSDNAVHSHYIQNNFLQDQMIEVGESAYPTFFDYDHDGDNDLFIGDKGYYDVNGIPLCMISLYENTGTNAAPVFTYRTRDFSGIYYTDSLIISGMAPTFGDLDGDLDEDMLVGDANGKLHYFQKNSANDSDFTLAQNNYQNIDVGSFATPQLVDVDRDGKIDLLIGEQAGNINYYHNDGTSAAPVFNLVTPLFGNVIVTQTGYTTGYSTPMLYDSAGTYILFVGSERGYLFRFDNIDGNLTGTFTLTDSMYVSPFEGGRIAPAICDLNNDGLFDVIIGNNAGGVALFYGDNTVSIEEFAPSTSFNLFPNPASGQVTVETDEVPDSKQFFTIYDLSGKEIMKEEIARQRTIVDTENLSNGIYICSMTDQKGYVVNKKLVISK